MIISHIVYNSEEILTVLVTLLKELNIFKF